MSDIKIAFGVTKDWIEYTFVTMCSILSNARSDDSYKFYIMSEISYDEFWTEFSNINVSLNKIHRFEYEYIRMKNKDFSGLVHDTRVGVAALYRLKLGSLTNDDKILYLDSDVVVLSDLSELWEKDINNFLVAGVEDKYSELMLCHANLDEGDIYINSGVLLMNLKKIRENNIENLVLNRLREIDTYSDQDVINDVCKGQIKYLPLKYNIMVTRDDPNSYPDKKDEYNEAVSNPVVLHYAIKPWIIPVKYSEYWLKYKKIIDSN